MVILLFNNYSCLGKVVILAEPDANFFGHLPHRAADESKLPPEDQSYLPE